MDNNERKDWVFGFLIFLTIATILWKLNTVFNPLTHLSWLEWYGIFMLFITIKTGVDTFRNTED